MRARTIVPARLAFPVLLILTVYLFDSGEMSATVGAQEQAQAPASEDTDAQRKAIREVADSLKGRVTVAHTAPIPKDWKPDKTPWGDRISPASIPTATKAASRSRGLPNSMDDGSRTSRPRSWTRSGAARNASNDRAGQRRRGAESPQLFWWENLNATNSRAWLVCRSTRRKDPADDARGAAAAAARRGAKRSGRGPADARRTAACTTAASREGFPVR